MAHDSWEPVKHIQAPELIKKYQMTMIGRKMKNSFTKKTSSDHQANSGEITKPEKPTKDHKACSVKNLGDLSDLGTSTKATKRRTYKNPITSTTIIINSCTMSTSSRPTSLVPCSPSSMSQSSPSPSPALAAALARDEAQEQ